MAGQLQQRVGAFFLRGYRVPGAARLLPSILLLAGCADCGFGASLQVHGPTPYVRCLAAEPPADRSWKVGAVAFQRTARALSLKGTPEQLRVAAFTGPPLGASIGAGEVAAVAAQKPDLALLVGGIGDDAKAAKATLAALGAAPFATLVLSGGRANGGDVAAALGALAGDAADRVIPIDTVRRVRIGADVLLPIPGAADGHYARTDDACGFGLGDLQAASGEVGSPVDAERRWLLSWNAPGRGGPLAIARTAQGVDLGSDALAEFASRVGASGGVHAWPRVRQVSAVGSAGTTPLQPGTSSTDAQLMVPPLGGPPLEDADGGLVDPGFAMVTLGAGGMRWLGVFPAAPVAVSTPARVPN